MSAELRCTAVFAVAALTTFLVTPTAIAVAVRTSFVDLPAGYKGHRRPTPYLGGTAIMAGILVATLLVSDLTSRYGVLIACASAIWIIGTLDDRVGLPIVPRLAAAVGVATLLWATGAGWTVFHLGAADLALTILWVVGVMNAFNLMDNMDGAAATAAAGSALGAGVLALVSGQGALAPLGFAVAGACVSFLPRNLANPARIFMGDGGSLPVGLLVAGLTMSVVRRGYLGPSGVVVAALLVGLVILDTTLVTISRTRGGRPVLQGGRDHLTHRLAARFGSPRNVALTLALTQLALCAITIAVAQAGFGWVLLAGGAGLALGGLLIWEFESTASFDAAPKPSGAQSMASTPVPTLGASVAMPSPRVSPRFDPQRARPDPREASPSSIVLPRLRRQGGADQPAEQPSHQP
ncbi:MAG: glycosyltransferase family 4 protein [Solirubrobacteraceae bacterium]